MRRPTTALPVARPGVAHRLRPVSPRIGRHRLPALDPTPPPGGWTLTAARAASEHYAATVDLSGGAVSARPPALARAALRAIATTTPRLLREDTRDRCASGADWSTCLASAG